MPAVSGSPTQNGSSAATPQDLAGLPDDAFFDGDFAYVRSLWPNGTFRLRRSAPAVAPDNVSTIATLSGNGYWEVFGARDAIYFPTVASIASYDDAALNEGATGFDGQTLSNWQKRVEAPAPAGDGITVVPTASGDGAWYRLAIPSTSWQGQSQWEIDATLGLDTNTGLPGFPLKTWAEFTRRVQTVVQPQTTVTLLTSVDEILCGYFKRGADDASLIVAGLPVVFATANATTFTDPQTTKVTNTRGTIAGSLAFDATHVGKIARVAADSTTPETLSEGPYVAPVLAFSAGNAQVPFWARWSLSNDRPANGSTVEVLTLPEVPSVQMQSDGLPMQVRYLQIRFRVYAVSSINEANILDRGAVSGQVLVPASAGYSAENGTYFACVFISHYHSGCNETVYVGCCFWGSSSDNNFYDGTHVLVGGGSIGNMFGAGRCGLSFQGSIVQGNINFSTSPYFGNPGFIRVVGATLGLGVFGAAAAGISLVSPGVVLAGDGILYGGGATSRNTTYGLSVSGGARVFLSTVPTITGTTGDLLFNSATSAVPPPTAGGVWAAAAAFNGSDSVGWDKWSNPAGPFYKQLVSYGNQSMVSGA